MNLSDLPDLAIERIALSVASGKGRRSFIKLMRLRLVCQQWRSCIDSMIKRAKFRSYFDHSKLVWSIFKGTSGLWKDTTSSLWNDSDGIEFLLERASAVAGIPYEPTADLKEYSSSFTHSPSVMRLTIRLLEQEDVIDILNNLLPSMLGRTGFIETVVYPACLERGIDISGVLKRGLETVDIRWSSLGADVVLFMIEQNIGPLPENAISLLCGTRLPLLNEPELNVVISSIDLGLNKADRFTVISNLVRNNYLDTAILIVKCLGQAKYKRKLWSLILDESNRDALADRLVEAGVECPSGGNQLIRTSHDGYEAAWVTMARVFGLDVIKDPLMQERIAKRLGVGQHEPESAIYVPSDDEAPGDGLRKDYENARTFYPPPDLSFFSSDEEDETEEKWAHEEGGPPSPKRGRVDHVDGLFIE